MSRIVVLSGGGLKSAVAAARYAGEHELILVHANLGHEFDERALEALHSLGASLPSGRVLPLDLPHLDQLVRSRRPAPVEASAPGRTRRPPPTDDAGNLRGLLPLLLSLGFQCAEQLGADMVVTGLSRLCAAPHMGMPASGGGLNGLREFLHGFQIAVEVMPPTGSKIRIETPLLDLSHGQIVKLGQRFGVRFDRTWSCDAAAPYPCKACESCKNRAKAFADAAVVDPLAAHAPSEPLRTQT